LANLKFASRADFVKCIDGVFKEVKAIKFDSGARQLAMSSIENFCKLLANLYVKGVKDKIRL